MNKEKQVKLVRSKIKAFKSLIDIDGDFVHLPLHEFVESIALLRREKNEAKVLLEELARLEMNDEFDEI